MKLAEPECEYMMGKLVHTPEGIRGLRDVKDLKPVDRWFAYSRRFFESCTDRSILHDFRHFMTNVLAKDERYADYKWLVRVFCLQ